MRIQLLLYQLEAGDNLTQHYQMYLETVHPCRMSQVKKWFPRAHVEKRMGTRAQAMNYCVKEDSQVQKPLILYKGRWIDSVENSQDFGELWERLVILTKDSKSSTKSSLMKIKSILCSGESNAIETIADDYFDIWVRYHRAFDRYLLMKQKPRDHPMRIFVLCGPSGTGKSRWAMDFDQKAYWKQRSGWWDGYCGQKTVVLDEFYGWLPYDTLLRLCDRYPLLVETKGGQVNMVADTIIITSNKSPSLWYKNVYFPAFERRVTSWVFMGHDGIRLEYDNWGDFEIQMNPFNII